MLESRLSGSFSLVIVAVARMAFWVTWGGPARWEMA